MRDFLLISVGAVLGANARYLIGVWAVERLGLELPFGTLAINVAGSLVVGLVLTVVGERAVADPAARLFLAVGFCGSFTTFSAFAYETHGLLRQGMTGTALLYAAASLILCVAAVGLGVLLGRLAS